jgi:hypothetical protein
MALRRVAVLVGASVLFLGACSPSGDASGDAASGPATGAATSGTTSGGPAPSDDPTDGEPPPYLPVPDGVVLTDQGSELGLGESAVVAWRPAANRLGVLDLTVRRLQRVPIDALADWQLDKAGRESSLFYVTVSVENVGDQDLAGTRIPLYVASGPTTLVESNAFRTEFKPCRSRALPKPFATGDKTTACLVYLVPDHGRLTSVTFRPSAKFNAITWVGDVEQPGKPGKKPKG